MAVFDSCSVLLDLKTLSFKEKKKLQSAVTENGGSVSFVVNKQCSLIVTSDVSKLSTNRLRSIQKYGTPVVGVDYVYGCLDRGVLLPVDEYKLDTSPPAASSPSRHLSSLRPAPLSRQVAEPMDPVAGPTPRAQTPQRSRRVLEKYRIYTEIDSDHPPYPDHFQVAKYSIYEKTNSNTWCVLELQSVRGESGRRYRVVRNWKNDVEVEKETLVFPSTSEEAVEVYHTLRDMSLAAGLQLRGSLPPQARALGSSVLQQLMLEENLNTGSVSQEVAVFVELLWTEALGQLSVTLRVPVHKLSLNDVSRAEGLLLQAQKKLKEEKRTEVTSLLEEFYVLLQHRVHLQLPDAKVISQKLDLCQLIRDVLNVSEMSLRSPAPSCVGKYRALRCSIETVPPGSSEFQVVTTPLQHSKVKIQKVLRVARGMELQTFQSELGNVRTLLHSSSPSNFVGILSRGLLMPRAGVEHHGIERTDIGNLGSGIYFSDAIRTSLKYSRPSTTDGSRLLLVCDVALGSCRDVRKRDPTLTEAPEGHHSVHGVGCTRHTPSEFEDDEYVVYGPDQVKLKYVVQFSMEGEELREFSPAVDTSAEPGRPPSDQVLSLEDDGVEVIKNPLEDVKVGLLDSSGQRLPLQAVHVKCKLMDLLSQVIIFQKYTNTSSLPIEAKYVFPLDDSAAVCGFEAFINGKHVVGKVKEKETARKEYRQAVEKGHGAYLMDQDAPDVFTISVGNLPPGASVLIKVTFVSELIVRDGSILFSLPGSVAPWQESAALNQTTQVTVEKVCVTDEAASTREFTLDMSVEMPNEISSLQCITHKVKIKKKKLLKLCECHNIQKVRHFRKEVLILKLCTICIQFHCLFRPQVACQVKRVASPGCRSVSVKWQQFNPTAAAPVQAPKQLHALFNDCHTLVYGFVPHCTQATLLGNLSGQELKTMVSTSELQKTKGTFLHKLTARALIRDYEDGSLDRDEAEHEGKKAELKSFIVELSREFSILSQFTSFVAIEERDSAGQPEEGFTDIPKLIAEEDVDLLPYISWDFPQKSGDDEEQEEEEVGGCFELEVLDLDHVESYFMEEGISNDLCLSWAPVSSDYSPMKASSWSVPSRVPEKERSRAKKKKRRSVRSIEEKHEVMESLSDKIESVSHTLLPPGPHPPTPTGSFDKLSSIGSCPKLTSSSLGHVRHSFGRMRQPARPPAYPSSSSGFVAAGLPQSKGSPFYGGMRQPAPPPPPPPPPPAYTSLVDQTFSDSLIHPPHPPHPYIASGFVVAGLPPSQGSPLFGSICPSAPPPPPPPPPPLLAYQSSLVQTGSSASPIPPPPPSLVGTPLLAADDTQGSSPGSVIRTLRSLSQRTSMYKMSARRKSSSSREMDAAFGATTPPIVQPAPALDACLDMETGYSDHMVSYLSFKRKPIDPEELKLKWTKIFQMQNSEGYWELTTQLGEFMSVDVDLFANVFLKNKGILSLGVRAHADILRLLATLLVLQLMREEEVEEGKLLRTLFCLDISSEPRPQRWEEVKRAVEWVRWADRQYPCIYSRLEFGLSWESSTRQLLGYEGLPPFSPLSSLNLWRTAAPLLVH
ncbi:putative poly [Scophthalmus maximus]|uniref:Poly [ADP-ribose] polymerase n=1 Tax=Scophthalmus maximus TaxID=52904 RepID=A0A2U9CAH6_SCOMX|nr:putative poly [Scophthalmus maximus]